MAPLSKAINVHYTSSSQGSKNVYEGDIDKDWIVGAVPNGGYSLALIVEACIKHQSSTTHRDPIHITAHYLRAVSLSHFEIHVRTLKSGRDFSNVIADLVQNGHIRITTHLIFGTLIPPPDYTGVPLTISPASPYARRLPLYTHPSQAEVVPVRSMWAYKNHIQWTTEPTILAKNQTNSPNRTNKMTVGGGGLEWGAWLQFMDKSETITTPMLAFLVDTFPNLPQLLPKSEREDLTTSWFPTMTLAIEFKFPIPVGYSKQTVGIYSTGKFMNDPRGRHDAYVEVWTAPSNVGEGKIEDGWRDKQVCLAIATQMALTLPIAVNQERGAKL